MDHYCTSTGHDRIVGYGSRSDVLMHNPYAQEIRYYVSAPPPPPPLVRTQTVVRSFQVVPQVTASTQTNPPVLLKSQAVHSTVSFQFIFVSHCIVILL